MEENKDIQISINEINEISFFVNPIPIPVEEINFGENLNIKIGFEFDIDQEIGIFKFSTSINFTIQKTAEPIVGIETEIVFDIPNLSTVVKVESNEQFQIENDFLATIAGVCIGTTRGMLAANLKGSPMAKFPLPILNPTEIIENMNKQREKLNKA